MVQRQERCWALSVSFFDCEFHLHTSFNTAGSSEVIPYKNLCSYVSFVVTKMYVLQTDLMHFLKKEYEKMWFPYVFAHDMSA